MEMRLPNESESPPDKPGLADCVYQVSITKRYFFVLRMLYWQTMFVFNQS